MEFPSLCSSVGKWKGREVELHIDPMVPPVTQPHRRIPFHVMDAVELELRLLVELGIIEPVTGPTPWVSPITVVPKPRSPGEIRLCVDMWHANKAIR